MNHYHYHDLACDDRPELDNCLRAFGLRVLAGQAHRFDTTTVVGRLVFGIFAALADFERELIRERTLAGLKAARAKGQQEVRAVESSGAARAGRDGTPRHLSGSVLCSEPRDQAGRVARAGREGPRLLNRESQATSPAAEHVLNLSVGFRPLPQTTRCRTRSRSSRRPTSRGR